MRVQQGGISHDPGALIGPRVLRHCGRPQRIVMPELLHVALHCLKRQACPQ